MLFCTAPESAGSRSIQSIESSNMAIFCSFLFMWDALLFVQ